MAFSTGRMSQIEPHFAVFFDFEREYQATENALAKIKSGQNGANLIAAIVREQTPEKYVQINATYDPSEITGTYSRLVRSQMNEYTAKLKPDTLPYNREALKMATNGEGVKPIVIYNPSQAMMVDSNGKPYAAISEKHSFVSLAHELVHAYHMIRGDSFGSDPRTSAADDDEHFREEVRAVGFHMYGNNLLSENGVRQDHGLPIRKGYFAE